MKINRDGYIQRIKASLSKKKVTFLLGARQVGKTTILKELQKSHFPKNTLYYSFDNIAELPKFTSTNEFLHYISIQSKTQLDSIEYLFLDEVQHIPNIEIFFKDLVDNYRQYSIIASGSGSFEIFHNIRESLLGRKETIYIYPLTFQEFLQYNNENLKMWKKNWYSDLFKEKEYLIEEYLRFGGYPAVVCAETEEKKFHELKNIVETWLDIDIRLLINKDEFLGFRHFLERVAQNNSALVKIDSIVQEMGIKNYKVKKFLYLLQKSFLLEFIEPFSRKRIDEIRSHKKLYFLDTGIYNYLSQNFSLNTDHLGKIIENFVFLELMKHKKESTEIKFWRTKNGTEIDFLAFDILHKKIDLFEVKSSSTSVIPKSFSGFLHNYSEEIHKIYLFNKNIFKTRKNDLGYKIHFYPYIFAALLQ